MKRKEQSVLLAGLLALSLAGCGTMGGGGGSGGDTASAPPAVGSESSTTSDMTTSGAGTAGSTAATGTGTGTGTGTATGSGTGSTAATDASGMSQAGQGGMMASTPNSTVASIEVVPRQSGSAGTGAGSVAGAAVGGATGSDAATSDRVYRVTLRMDDGTTQVITQESTPSFSTGDRVRVASGAIVR